MSGFWIAVLVTAGAYAGFGYGFWSGRRLGFARGREERAAATPSTYEADAARRHFNDTDF